MKKSKKTVNISKLVSVLRSKNAGIMFFGCDLLFKDKSSYLLGKKHITKRMISKLYKMPVEQVKVIPYDPGLGIKIVIQRPAISGDHRDTDVYGAQQHVPLLSIELPTK